jgi:hypothetical protein
MLDVHPPHAPTHTWKDFFLHIATIVIGLLIAVGLEQSVEWLHHKHQISEVRASLAQERDLNRRILDRDNEMLLQMDAELSADTELLQRRIAGDKSSLPGRLHYEWASYAAIDGAWQAAIQNGSLSLMPEEEVRNISYRYHIIAVYLEASRELNRMIEQAGAVASATPDGSYSQDEVHALLGLTSAARGQLRLSRRYLAYALQSGLTAPDYGYLDRPARKLY